MSATTRIKTRGGGLMGFLDKLFGDGIKGVLDSAGGIIDKFVESPEDKIQLKTMLMEQELKLKQQIFDAQNEAYKDKQSARTMYEKDSSLQKIFSITFLVGYIGVTVFLLYSLFSGTMADMEHWGVALISSIFTAMSTKVATICDFLFGGSSSPDKGLQIPETKKK